MHSLGKPIPPFPFFNQIITQTSPDDCVGIGIWTDESIVVALRSAHTQRWVGIVDQHRLAIEARFHLRNGTLDSIVFAGGAIGDGSHREISDDEEQLERVVTLAKTFTQGMRPVIVVSEQALSDAMAMQGDRASTLFLQQVDAHLNLLTYNGIWLPLLHAR